MEFKPWPKTPRLFRDIVVTEKIDGTNSAIQINRITDEEAATSPGYVTTDKDGVIWEVGAQSRNRLLFPGKDNFGFAAWVFDNAYELRTSLGEGIHYGEWWGKGIQRNYGQATKHFSLFNTHRHANIEKDSRGLLNVVPVIYQGANREREVRFAIADLQEHGSVAAPGFMNPEGVCVYHSASNRVYKVLIENDELAKGQVAA